MSPFLSALALIAAPLAAAASMAGGVRAPMPPVIGAYFPGYAAARYPVERIPAERLTHLFYAFARIENGKCAVEPAAADHLAAFARLKREHPHLRTLISIGGWEADGFSDAALTAASRERLVGSCLALFFDRYRGSFDGVDIDWEYPVYGGPPTITARPQDRRNMTLLARAFRRRLDALGASRQETYLLTAALPAGRLQFGGAYDPARSFDLKALAGTLDFINLMTYDMGTANLRVTSLTAPLHPDPHGPLAPRLRRSNTVAGAVDNYLRRGVPADRLVLGAPFHARGVRVTTVENHGLYQPFGEPLEAGDWRDLSTTLLHDPNWQQHWHASAQSPWLFEPQQRIFVSYENPRSIGIRATFAKERGLRGVFMWQLTADDDANSLLTAMEEPFRP